jgi:hypothetical protein
MNGNSQYSTADVLRANAADEKARSIIVKPGELADTDLQHVRDNGLTDCDIVETVTNVVLNIFMNYPDLVARPTVDFSQIEAGD